MAVRLSGIPVAREMRGRIQAGVEQLHQIGQIPTMGIVRVGARPEDISYETGATKLAQSLGIAVSRTLLPGDVGERQLLEVLREVNEKSEDPWLPALPAASGPSEHARGPGSAVSGEGY